MTRKKLECSIYKTTNPSSPCIIYSHSHSGNRAEGAYLVEALANSFNLVTFDYTGYGYSDIDKCTLGLKEMDDLETVIDHVRKQFQFRRIFIWGRSMGAVTAVLLCHRSGGKICDGLVLDSPYSSTKEMLCNVMEKVPNFLLYLLFMPLGDKLKAETGHDMISTDLNSVVPHLIVPVLFLVADGDTLAGVKNVENLFNVYGNDQISTEVKKQLIIFEGDHASKRDDDLIAKGREFLESVVRQLDNSQQPIQRLNTGHFAARQHIMAVHDSSMPARLKKSDVDSYLDDPDGIENSILESMNEFRSNRVHHSKLNNPLKVRGVPEDVSKLQLAKGDLQGDLRSTNNEGENYELSAMNEHSNTRFGSAGNLKTLGDTKQTSMDVSLLKVGISNIDVEQPSRRGEGPSQEDLEIRILLGQLTLPGSLVKKEFESDFKIDH